MRDPDELHLLPDHGLRRVAGGRVLIGGSPLRVLRVSSAGAGLIDGWLAGAPVGPARAHRALAARLTDAGMAHPHYRGRFGAADVTVVVPVKDHAAALSRLLPALHGVAEVVVVDDGSAAPVRGARVRHATARGPAAARNAGWRLVNTEFVAFLDADALPEPGWLDPLLAHFTDPDVAAVAPRVRSLPGTSALARYEREQSSLDLGPRPAIVRPGSSVSYLPTAALLVRTVALRAVGGFDEAMRYGEDVDLIWRLVAGHTVRYEPGAVVAHQPRASWPRWLRQRFEYGTAAAPLARRHGAAVTPARMSVSSAATWAALVAGRPVVAAGIAAGSAALLPGKLARSGVPTALAVRLAATGHLGAGTLLAEALTRTWLPFALPALASRRGRLVLAAATARHLVAWLRVPPPLDPVRWYLARVADDAAYGAGVCWGCATRRTARPLVPTLTGLPWRQFMQKMPGVWTTRRVRPRRRAAAVATPRAAPRDTREGPSTAAG